MLKRSEDPKRRAALRRAAVLLWKGKTPYRIAATEEPALAKSVVQNLKLFLTASVPEGRLLSAMQKTWVVAAAERYYLKRGRPRRIDSGTTAVRAKEGGWYRVDVPTPARTKQQLAALAHSRGVALGPNPYALRIQRVTTAGADFVRLGLRSSYYLVASTPAGRRGLAYRLPQGPDPQAVADGLRALRDVVGPGLRVLHGPKRVFRSILVREGMGARTFIELFQSEPAWPTAARLIFVEPGFVARPSAPSASAPASGTNVWGAAAQWGPWDAWPRPSPKSSERNDYRVQKEGEGDWD